MDFYMAMINLFAGNFAPRNFSYCNGQIISIAQNTALFSLLGTTYGGDGQTTFALPDLRGRTPIGPEQGPGLSNYALGQVGGTETITLTIQQMPQHTHALQATSNSTQAGSAIATNGDATTPENNYLALSPKIGSGPNATQLKTYATTPPAPVPPATPISPVKLAGGAITTSTSGNTTIAGGSQPFSIKNPYLAIYYVICIAGIFPSRN